MRFTLRGRVARRTAQAVALVAGVLAPGAALALETLRFNTGSAPEEVAENLRGASLLLQAKQDGVTNAQDILSAARADYGRLLSALYASGRYSGVIRIRLDGREAAQISPLSVPARINRAEIVIDPGPPFQFGRTRIAPLADGTELPEGFRAGAPAESPMVGEAVTAAIDGWRDVGHAKADVARQGVQADHRARRLDVDVALAPGPRLRFGRLLLSGESAVREARIRKIAGFPEGEVFSPDDLATVAKRLRRTGTFRSVSLTEAERIGPNNTLDVTAAIVDEKPRRFGFGAEVSTIEGANLSAFWLHRNLLGGAERFRVDGEIGGIGGETGGLDYALGARYERPATPTPDTSLYVETGVERLDEPDYLSDQFRFGVGLRRIFSDDLEGELGIEIRHSRVEDVTGVQRFQLLSFPVSATLDRRDNTLNPTDGYYLRAELRPFVGFGDTSSGGRLFADGRIYQALGERVVLAGRAQLGSVVGPSVADAPPDYLFYSGGGGTVRGQSYQSLGVDLGGGLRRGGRSFLGLSGEVRMGLTDRLGVVGFADAGYVGSGSFYDGSGDWHSGAGIGLRYNTGIGPIRLDVAVPVSGGGSGFQVYVGIGQAF